MRRFLLLLSLALLAVALVAVAPAAAWTWPTGGPVLLAFSFDPAHPYSAGEHRWIDIGGDPGSAVLAPAAGVVTFAGTVPGNGRSLTILTSDGWSVTLTQLRSVGVAKGASVAEGDAVATIGPSGDAEVAGPYMQLGIRHADQDQGYVDPQTLLPPRAQAPTSPTTTGGAVQPPPAVSVPTSTTPVDGSSVTTDPAAVAPAPAAPPPQPTISPAVAAAVPATVPQPTVAPAGQTTTRVDATPVVTPAGRTQPVEVPRPVVDPARAVLPVFIHGSYVEPAARQTPAPGRTTIAPPPVSTVEVTMPAQVVVAQPRVASAEAAVEAPSPPEVSHPLIAVDGALAGISGSRSAQPSPLRVRHGAARPIVPAGARRHPVVATSHRHHGPPAFVRWLAAVVPTLALAWLLAVGRLRVTRRPARMIALDEIRGSEDPRRSGLAVCGGTSPPWPRGGLRRPVGRLRPLSPAARERRAHGERNGRARYAGDGGRRQGREVGR